MDATHRHHPIPLLTLREVSDELGVSLATVKRLVASGQLHSGLLGNRRRVPRWALDEYLERAGLTQGAR